LQALGLVSFGWMYLFYLISEVPVIIFPFSPECRLPRAHDPYNPIISLSLCDMLAEREHMLEIHPDLALPESPAASRRASTTLKRPREWTIDEADIAELLAAITRQKVESLWTCVQSMLTVEKPLLRIFKETTRALYLGSILLFGNMDRQALSR
jgi:hypothetical protein